MPKLDLLVSQTVSTVLSGQNSDHETRDYIKQLILIMLGDAASMAPDFEVKGLLNASSMSITSQAWEDMVTRMATLLDSILVHYQIDHLPILGRLVRVLFGQEAPRLSYDDSTADKTSIAFDSEKRGLRIEFPHLGAENEARADTDLVVNIPRLILGYGGRILLNRTSLQLRKGRRYGLVGENGVGKTTMMTRMANRDIVGWPTHLNSVYVQHEILTGEIMTAWDFCMGKSVRQKQRASEANVMADTDEVARALTAVGFDLDQAKATVVSTLSGGWRMRLAIARAMVERADILLLDEPTNHLDVGAIAWLADYLCSLESCTIVLVSHDEDFARKVLTDVIHFYDKKLTYHTEGLDAFHQIKPQEKANRSQLLSQGLSKAKGAASQGGAGSAVSAAATGTSSSSSLSNKKPVLSGDKFIRAYLKADSRQILDEAASKLAVSRNKLSSQHGHAFRFPRPGPIDGVLSKTKRIAYMYNLNFKYPNTTRTVLHEVNIKLTMGSRVGVLGKNGSGKSTLVKLLVGDLVVPQEENEDNIWKNPNLRVSYIAQHSLQHLMSHMTLTLIQYLKLRFKHGVDKETAELSAMAFTEQEQREIRDVGAVTEIVGRRKRRGMYEYEFRRDGYPDTYWLPPHLFQKTYEQKMIRLYDEKLAADAAGISLRPLSDAEILLHLEDFGIKKEVAEGKIERLSGGQRSRLALAAACWMKPHLLCLDEPTNYLDIESLDALFDALHKFKGGVVLITHNERFIRHLCNEWWLVKDGHVDITNNLQDVDQRISEIADYEQQIRSLRT